MERNTKPFGARVGVFAVKAITLLLLFPYQIVVNKKEGKFSIRSLALAFSVNRKVDDEGKKSRDYKLSCPGYDFSEAADKMRKRRAAWKKEKKAAKKKAKAAKKAAETLDVTVEA